MASVCSRFEPASLALAATFVGSENSEKSLVYVDTSTVFPAAEVLKAFCLADEAKLISS